MRAAILIVLALPACGASTPAPRAASSEDTSSLESKSPSSKEAASDSTSPAPSAATEAPVASSSPASSAAAAETAAPTPLHPVPSVTGVIDGKPFAPKVAQVLGPMKKDGRILLALTESTDCPAPGDSKVDRPTLTMVVPWQDGYKVDLAALKLTGKKGPGDIGFSRGKKDVSTTFKPSGTVTVVSAPLDKASTGKLKIDLQSGGYMLAGTLDVEMCVGPK